MKVKKMFPKFSDSEVAQEVRETAAPLFDKKVQVAIQKEEEEENEQEEDEPEEEEESE